MVGVPQVFRDSHCIVDSSMPSAGAGIAAYPSMHSYFTVVPTSTSVSALMSSYAEP